MDKLAGRKTLKVSSILNEFEKDRIKATVDIVSLFASFGVALEKKGKSYLGKCPWHEDSTPSLSVDREKGLYNCFGCGEAGDAFTLVQKMKGVDFKGALEYLKSGNGAVSPLPQKPTAYQPPVPASSTLDTRRLLEEVAERYRKNLLASSEARAYLASRGLDDGELVKTFRLGYADGKLAEVVSEEQRRVLVELGLLTEDGREHFARCVVVPLVAGDGRIVSFYGRKIDESNPAHLYARGPHAGVVNREAARVYRDSVILTEAVLDALSLYRLGILNVIPCYGANGFTAEHEALVKDERVAEVIIAFDADEAGRKGAAVLAERLTARGISVKRVESPNGKDWNDFLKQGGTKTEFDALCSSAESAGGTAASTTIEAAKSAGLTLRHEAGRYTFQREGSQHAAVRYRVGGARESFSASLRVSVRAELTAVDGSARGYVDTVDLYSARSRSAFALSCASSLSGSLDAARVEKDLLEMLDLFEKEREARFAGEESASRVMSDEERRLGMELLADPALTRRVVEDLTTMGYVGEEVNKLLMYLAATSRKMTEPISIIVSSQSASGKSYLIDTVKRLMPEEDVVSMTSLSEQALNYLGDEALLHKFLVMGEAVYAETVEHQIREMLSSRELSRLVTLKDEKTGELSSRLVRKRAVVALAMSTTRAEVNPENASRCFVLSTDESEEQTKAVHAAQRSKYLLASQSNRAERIEEIVSRHRAAQRLLENVLVINPYAHLLDFPARLMRTRRDHERFLDLIAAVCFLRQFQKEKGVDERGRSYVSCDREDYRVAYGILTAILPSTLSSIPRAARELYEAVRRLAREKGEREGVPPEMVLLTQREIREGTGDSSFLVKSGLRLLFELEYLGISGSRVRGSRNAYRLLADEKLTLVDLSAILTPEELAARAAKEGIAL